MLDVGDGPAERNPRTALRAFFHQHGDDLAGGAVAEQLPQRLLVP